MPVGESRLFRQMLEMAHLQQAQDRLNQLREQGRAEAVSRAVEADKKDQEAFEKRAEATRQSNLRGALADTMAPPSAPPVFTSAPPDPTGGAPSTAPGYGATADEVAPTPQPFDGRALMQLLVQVDPKYALDAHAQPFMQQAGMVQSPEEIKLRAQAANRARGVPGTSAAIRAFNPSVEQDVADLIARDVPTSELSSIIPMSVRQQQADTGSRGVTLREDNAYLRTPQAQFNADNTRIRTDAFVKNIEDRLADLQATLPTRVEQQAAGAEANRERAATTREMRPVQVEGGKKRNAQIGTTKAGKPAESDKRVVAWVQEYLTSPEFADVPEDKGLFRSTPAKSRREQAAEDARTEANPTVRDIKLRAYQEAFGGGQGGSTAPSASTNAPTATGPNGQKLILQNGQWVPYGR